MPISEIPIFSMLRTKLHWNQERQQLLAENIANADTPQFKPSDLAPLSFQPATAPGVAGVSLARTSALHLASSEETPSFKQQAGHDFEVVPSGNAVNLDDEMLKVAANQMEFQTATTLYTQSLGLIKAAIGK